MAAPATNADLYWGSVANPPAKAPAAKAPSAAGAKAYYAANTPAHPGFFGSPQGTVAGALAQKRLPLLPNHIGGSYAYNPPKTQTKQGGVNRPTGTSGTPTFEQVFGKPAKVQSTAQYLAQLQAIAKQLNTGVNVPGSLSLANIAKTLNSVPTSPNMPGSLSLASIQNALTPSANTPGYVNAGQAATAAAQAQFGSALASDTSNIAQQRAQSQQNQQDIMNWYNNLTQMQQAGAASDAAGYNQAITSTGNLGGALSGALGFDAGSAGADTIGQTGSILNGLAQAQKSSGMDLDNNLMTVSRLGGLQDTQNQKNTDANTLAGLLQQQNQDQTNKGAAYTTALDAAKQANAQNASAYSTNLANLNTAYQNNFNNKVKSVTGKASALAGLNNQYTTQALNQKKLGLGAISTAAGIASAPGAAAAAGAKTVETQADAYNKFMTAQANTIKANTAAQAAKLKAQGTSLTSNSPAAAQARSGVAETLVKDITSDPRVFAKDATTGTTSLKSRAQAIQDVTAMLMQADLDPTSGWGKLMFDTTLARLGISPTKKKK